MYKLLGRQTSGNVQKVLFMLEECGADYEREDYGRQFENTQTPEYKAMNPTAKVPTLIDGEVVIWESNTILRYLAAADGDRLTGATPAEKADVERWMDFLLAAVNPGYWLPSRAPSWRRRSARRSMTDRSRTSSRS
jgi:glutathione S-transferase